MKEVVSMSLEADAQASLVDAEHTFRQAEARHLEATAKAHAARRASDEGAAAAQGMLDEAAAGNASLEVASHAAAVEAADKLAHVARVAETIAAGALARKEVTELALLRARAADHVHTVKAAVAAELAAAEAIDDVLTEARWRIERFRARATAAAEAVAAARRFDEALPAVLAGSATARRLLPQELPRTNLELRSSAANISIALSWVDTRQQLHQLIGSLASWRRALWGNLAAAKTGAAVGRMVAAVNIMGTAWR
jgi:hypothetical protein